MNALARCARSVRDHNHALLETTNQGGLSSLRSGIATGLLRIEFLEYMVNSELIQVICSISGFYSYFAIVKSL